MNKYKKYMKEKKWKQAIACCDVILKDNPNDKYALIKKGIALVSQRNWSDGIRILEIGLEESSGMTLPWYKLAEAFIRRDGREILLTNEKAKCCLEIGISNEKNNRDLLLRLLESQLYAFLPRKKILEFLQKNISRINIAANQIISEYDQEKVFMYWGQGLHNAPPLVKRCAEQAQTIHGDKFVFLDSETWPFYVDIPINTLEKSSRRPAFFSDVLRVNLLARYGGVWIDATCFVMHDLLKMKSELAPSGFFAFYLSGARISNWLLMSDAGNVLARMMTAALDCYWENFETELEYFFFHHIFEILCMLDEKCNAVWEGGVRLSNIPPLLLIKHMMDDYEHSAYDQMLNGSFIHKLTYKYDDSQNHSRTVLSKIIRG